MLEAKFEDDHLHKTTILYIKLSPWQQLKTTSDFTKKGSHKQTISKEFPEIVIEIKTCLWEQVNGCI